MRLHQTLLALLTFLTTIHAFALPAALEPYTDAAHSLFKRKGGGGGRGGGGGFRSSGGSSSSSSSARTSRLGSASSNAGGRTSTGTGIQPRRYPGGGAFYGGGATSPYRSGRRSPGGIAPVFLGAGALGFFPGLWLYGAYAYDYDRPYTYHNRSSGENMTLPVDCFCSRFAECGCDQVAKSGNQMYINSLANNASLSHVVERNGRTILAINGTLPNGTTVASKAAPGARSGLGEWSGWWVVIAGVAYAVSSL